MTNCIIIDKDPTQVILFPSENKAEASKHFFDYYKRNTYSANHIKDALKYDYDADIYYLTDLSNALLIKKLTYNLLALFKDRFAKQKAEMYQQLNNVDKATMMKTLYEDYDAYAVLDTKLI